MKKLISIILAVIIAFSTITVGVSAYTVDTEGVVWIGCDGDVAYADPGATKDIPISVAANVSALFTENEDNIVDAATAVMTIPFSIKTDANSPITKVALTDAAVAAGATFDQKSATETLVDGTITLPYAALKGADSMVVVNVTVKMADDWEVVEYVATNPVLVKVSENYGNAGVTIVDGNGKKVSATLMMNDFTIKATLYKPNFIEKIIEWIKKLFTYIPSLFETLDGVLIGLLEKPDWVIGLEEREARDLAEAEAAQQADA